MAPRQTRSQGERTSSASLMADVLHAPCGLLHRTVILAWSSSKSPFVHGSTPSEGMGRAIHALHAVCIHSHAQGSRI
jgi:hypothetical protein